MCAKVPTDEQLEAAQALHEMGWTYQRIADHFGFTYQTAKRWANPKAREQQRLYNITPERRAQKRASYHKRAHIPCPRCGGSMQRDNKMGICVRCWRLEQSEPAMKRRWQIVEWWEQGMLRRDIAKRLGWSNNRISVELGRMRKTGYNLPQRPPGGFNARRKGNRFARQD